MKFYILFHVARGILVISMSITSFDSVFNMKGQVLDSFKSSSSPTIVETLVFSQNWLSTTPKVIELWEEMNQKQKIE